MVHFWVSRTKMNNKTLAIVLGILSISLLASAEVPKGCFRAAVLDHVQQVVGNLFNPTEENLRAEIDLNHKMYEKAAQKAKMEVSC